MPKVPQHILKLSKEEKRKFAESFDTVLSDCDGVLWTLTGGIPGIKEGIEVLAKLNKKLGFVSNNSIRSRSRYTQAFESIGVKFDYDHDLVHPAAAFADYLKKINFDKTVFLIGGEIHKQFLRDKGIKFIVADDSHSDPGVVALYQKLFANNIKEEIGAVAMDFDINFNMGKFFSAEYFLQNPDCLLLVGGTDLNYWLYDYSFAGMGVWVQNLLARVPQTPIGLGKPGSELGQFMMDKFQIKDRSRVLFVGDTLEQDIGFANSNGFKTLLVLSGVTTEKMLEELAKENEVPDYYANSLHDFVEFYKELQESKL